MVLTCIRGTVLGGRADVTVRERKNLEEEESGEREPLKDCVMSSGHFVMLGNSAGRVAEKGSPL